jgi:hypothetical protein
LLVGFDTIMLGRLALDVLFGRGTLRLNGARYPQREVQVCVGHHMSPALPKPRMERKFQLFRLGS